MHAAGKVVYFERWADPAALEVLAGAPGIAVERLSYDAPEDESWRALGAAHVYQIMSARDETPATWHATPALLERCPGLLAVSAWGAGYDTVDVAACTAAGVALVNQAGGNREAVAEHALGMMLALSKRIGETDHLMRRERLYDRNAFMGRNIEGMTLGIVGLGNIGRRVAELCGGPFRMRVLACDPYLSEADFAERGAEGVSLAALLAEADIVTVHCPRSAETIGMFNAASFARMKPGALFINTARGGIHDEAALHEALAAGHLGGAGLDVWSTEPPDPAHPLLALPNVLASQHTAGVTRESRRQVAVYAAEQIIELLSGRYPPRLVNPEVWPVFAQRFEAALGRAPETQPKS